MNPLLGPNPRPPGVGAGDPDDAQMGNGPDAGDLEQPKPASPAGSPAPSPLQMHLDHSRAQFDQVAGVAKMLGVVRSELDALTKLGDAVTTEDVFKGAGKIVAEGGDPKQIMAMIAGNPQGNSPPMPQGGQALAAWLQQQDQMVKSREQQLGPAQAMASHETLAASFQALAHDHMMQHPGMQARSGSSPDMTGASPQGPSPSPAGANLLGSNPLMPAPSPSGSIH